MSDDFGANAAGSAALTLGVQSQGNIETVGDRDWFAVNLEAGKTYRIRIEGDANENGTLDDPLLGGIFDATEALIEDTSDDDSGFGLNSQFDFTPATTGVYYIEAGSFGDATGTYGVTVEELSVGSEFSVIALNVTRLEGDAGSTAFEFTITRSGDVDTAASIDWTVNPLIGNSVDVDDFVGAAFPNGTAAFTEGQTSASISVEIAGDTDVELNESFTFDLTNPSAGSTIAPGNGSKLGTVIDDDSLGEGTTFLALTSSMFQYEGQVGLTPYFFTVTRTGDTSLAATADWNLLPIPGSETVDGGDFEGGTLPFGMVSFDPGETSKLITVYVAGDTAAEEHESFSIVLSNPSEQAEIISSGSLVFASIFDDDEDDFGVTPETAGKLSPGLSVFGVLGDSADVDWICVELLAGSSYAIDLEGLDTLQGSLMNPLIEGIFDENSILIADSSDDDSGIGLNSRLLFTPAADGQYYIALAASGEVAGSYRLTVKLDSNNQPTGEVIITGTAEQGQELMASETLVDADGKGAISYQWYADGSPIAGATGEALLLMQDQVGKVVSVEASYTDGVGNLESVFSGDTAVVANINDSPAGEVAITGTPQEGQELTAMDTLDDPDGLGVFMYQWSANGLPIAGATESTYTPGTDDIGKTITVTISYTDGFGNEESVDSAATEPVEAGGELIEGTAGPDLLQGTDGHDTLLGKEGRDTLEGMDGDDLLDGGDDIDSALFDGNLLDFSILNNEGTLQVSVLQGNDTLENIERLHFDDCSLAFDLDGHAGQVAKLLRILLGPDNWESKELNGIGLDILDAGFTYQELMDVALSVVVPSRTNEGVVSLLFENLVGSPPPQPVLEDLVGLLEAGTFTQVGLAIAAGDHELNLANINLVGLIEFGLEYQPVG